MARSHNIAIPVALPDLPWLRAFRRRLGTWYDKHARDLPWRRNRDPYAVWLSEIMLQQTQVATVRPYFEQFLARFPTLEALARADEQEVLRLWEGLGYYRRARQLHQAAKVLLADHNAQFPRDIAVVRRLPGIGRYTAGAILSIAFDARQPILEANTVRLFSRLLAYRDDPASTAGQRLLWTMAETVLPARRAGRFNQALMELGSQVCLARAPRCQQCPVASLCRANLQQLQAVVPCPKKKPPIEAVRQATVIVRRGGRVLLVQNPDGARWAGLWDFPRSTVRGEHSREIHRELKGYVRQLTGVVIRPGAHLRTIRHGVTRFRITLECYEAEYVANADGKPPEVEVRWVRPSELNKYPLSSTGRRLGALAAAVNS